MCSGIVYLSMIPTKRTPKIDISAYLTSISGVGKSDRCGLGHPGGLITRKSVVQIYSPLLVLIHSKPVRIRLKSDMIYPVVSLRRSGQVPVCSYCGIVYTL